MSVNRDHFKLAYHNLRAARGRSLLTMLGIIIAVMAVILVVCIGQGVKQQIAGDLGRYGDNVFVVRPGAAPHGGNVLGALVTGSNTLLTANDLKAVQQTKGVASAVPFSTVSGSITGDYTVETPTIIATNTDFADIVQHEMDSGGFFDAGNESRGVVLGFDIAQKLFNDRVPLGQALVWRGERFMVSGVFKTFNAPPLSLESGFNDAIFVPYPAAQKLTGSVLGIYQIVARTDASAEAAKVVQDADAALVAAHSGARDVTVLSASEVNGAADETIRLLTLLITGAAIIALIVGGVGIMNMMLVSVTERMYEIGLRKAIGATNQQILRQFVTEAFLISLYGALAGLLLACAVVGLLRMYTSLQAVIVWEVLLVAPVAAIVVGLFFGSVPAIKAARKDPIAALRHD